MTSYLGISKKFGSWPQKVSKDKKGLFLSLRPQIWSRRCFRYFKEPFLRRCLGSFSGGSGKDQGELTSFLLFFFRWFFVIFFVIFSWMHWDSRKLFSFKGVLQSVQDFRNVQLSLHGDLFSCNLEAWQSAAASAKKVKIKTNFFGMDNCMIFCLLCWHMLRSVAEHSYPS